MEPNKCPACGGLNGGHANRRCSLMTLEYAQQEIINVEQKWIQLCIDANRQHQQSFARIKKELAFYQGKVAALKAENNKLRKKQYSKANAELQAKCDRYEAALKEIVERVPYIDNASRIAKKALSAGEGEKEAVKDIEYMPILSAELNEKEYRGMNNVPIRVPMHLLNEQQAYSNHGQSLARLKERGGLSIRESLLLITRQHWLYYKGMEAKKAVAMLNDLINQKEDKQ
jgi:hypothetical protein